MIFGYIGCAIFFYLCYGIHHSKGNNGGWKDIMRKSINNEYGQDDLKEPLVTQINSNDKY